MDWTVLYSCIGLYLLIQKERSGEEGRERDRGRDRREKEKNRKEEEKEKERERKSKRERDRGKLKLISIRLRRLYHIIIGDVFHDNFLIFLFGV